MMNYRLQLSPISGTRESHVDLPSRERGEGPPPNSEDASVFRSWLVFDSDLEPVRGGSRGNWNTVLGLALAVVVSVSFWVGVGIMMASFWK
jgi:hypothetical protein